MKRIMKLLTLVMVLFYSWSGVLYANDPTLQVPYAADSKLFMVAFAVLALIMIFLISVIIIGFKRSRGQLIEAQSPGKKKNRTD